MARYAEINSDIFDDLINEGLSHKAIYMYLFYAITSTNLIGLYRTRADRDRVSAGLDRVSWVACKKVLQEKGKIKWEDGWVWIVGKANKIRGKKQMLSARKLLREIPNSLTLKGEFFAKYDTLSRFCDGVSANAEPIPIPKKRKEVKTSPDKRVGRLLSFFGVAFKDTFSVNYKPNFAGDSRIIKDQLRYADKSYSEGRAELALAVR